MATAPPPTETRVAANGARALHAIAEGRVMPLADLPEPERSESMRSVVEQEVFGRRLGPVPARVTHLLERFGFAWEPASEPGHMRYLSLAADMMRRAGERATTVARAVAEDLDLPFDRIDGVNVVDRQASQLRDYLAVIEQASESYGDGPYRLAAPSSELGLRQTGCLQKYSIAREWGMSAADLPRCVYELSDSYRRESEELLQLCFRLRRFRLPECHLHASSMAETLDLALAVHETIVADLECWASDYAMLITTSNAFAERHGDFLARLAKSTERQGLLQVCPPSAPCEGGIEIDIEYKVLDAGGFARELNTFQIDERIAGLFGIGSPSEPITTIHAVLTGGLERSIFFALDRVAAAERRGRAARLPTWLSPYAVRAILPAGADPGQGRLRSVCARLEAGGLHVEVDDRAMSFGDKLAAAEADLVPYQLRFSGGVDEVGVWSFDDGPIQAGSLDEALTRVLAAEVARPHGARRLSHSAIGARR